MVARSPRMPAPCYSARPIVRLTEHVRRLLRRHAHRWAGGAPGRDLGDAAQVVGIALGYEDLNDHDELRHDPVLAVLAGRLPRRSSSDWRKPLCWQINVWSPAGTDFRELSRNPL